MKILTNLETRARHKAKKSSRKEVKTFLSSKKTLESFSSGFAKKESSRVLNMKDMNLSSKINNCFGNFYKKLDTFADLANRYPKLRRKAAPKFIIPQSYKKNPLAVALV